MIIVSSPNNPANLMTDNALFGFPGELANFILAPWVSLYYSLYKDLMKLATCTLKLATSGSEIS